MRRTAYPDLALLVVDLTMIAVVGIVSWWTVGVVAFTFVVVARRSYVLWCQEQRERNRQDWVGRR
jgi:hypothetical protein